MATHDVTIRNFAYSPRDVTIAIGDTVVWISMDNVAHTVTADDGSFDSGDLRRDGPPFERTFKEAAPDPIKYHCDHHGGMKGSVIVAAAAKPDPAAR